MTRSWKANEPMTLQDSAMRFWDFRFHSVPTLLRENNWKLAARTNRWPGRLTMCRSTSITILSLVSIGAAAELPELRSSSDLPVLKGSLKFAIFRELVEGKTL